MSISKPIADALQNASWIRRMFETGRVLKERHGSENVFDFSLGNPFLEPPEEFQTALRGLVNSGEPGLHRYMANNGHTEVRTAVADYMSKSEKCDVHADDVVMTVGAAGALNVALRSLLDPGDEVLILAPFFVEYLFYASFQGGSPRVVQTTDDFDLDIPAIEAAISERTKVLIINTPNNPTGRIYSEARMRELGDVLARAEKRLGREIYLLADTPYAKITYDGLTNPPLFASHPNTLIAHSHSKDLGLAGERIGYIVVGENAAHREDIRGALTFCNRALGFVNAPALMQKALALSINASVDTSIYARIRDRFCQGLKAAGYEFVAPQGAFYIFARTPIDDVEFAQALQRENILVVPGRGFGRAGHMRISYCVEEQVVEEALPRFAKVMSDVQNKPH
ncbi:MAG: pyridoxal phosphate-dependent aminotransferase [Deltaproteobacteria bacterium]|nr:pyridoxal phosphate-dependent aminotransferase [Deltaproteobacteria bacterium]